MSDPLDQKQIIFTILQLLGFDAAAMEASSKVPFNKNMFDLPNKKGAEVVLHFLFNRLNPIMCREEFRNCWPVTDKSEEQQFRRTCHNWMTNIAKSEPESHLPRIVASLFMSPGGDKFYNVLFHFCRYVLNQVIHSENGIKDFEYLRYPILTQQTASLGDVIAKHVQCAVARLRKKYIEEIHTTMYLNKEWKEYSMELVKDYRKLSKEIREMEHKIRVEQQTAVAKGAARGSPMVRKRRSNSYDFEFDSQSVKRTQRIQQVREMWKHLNDFCGREAEEREVIESIVDRTLTQHRIDAGEINVKVPDLLLRECEQEIRRRHVDNTFQSGKLNLISLVQLWNLCLHLYIERLHQDGVPDFTNEIGNVTRHVHTNHAYLANAKTLKKQISNTIPELRQSVQNLRAKMDSHAFKNATPSSIRTMSIGIGLTESSPSVSFTPGHKPTGVTPKEHVLHRTPDNVPTPEAAGRIVQGVQTQVRKGPVKLFQGFPEYAPRMDASTASSKSGTSSKSNVSTKLPRKRAHASTQRDKQQLQSTPTNAVKTMSRVQPSPRSVDVRHLIHGSGNNRNSSSRKKSPKSPSMDSESSAKNSFVKEDKTPVRSPGEGQRSIEVELSPSDLIVNRILNASGGLLSPEGMAVDIITGDRNSLNLSGESQRSNRHSLKEESSLRGNVSIHSQKSDKSNNTLVNSMHSANVSIGSQRLGSSMSSERTLVESILSTKDSPRSCNSFNDHRDMPGSLHQSPRLNESVHSQRSGKSFGSGHSQGSRALANDSPLLLNGSKEFYHLLADSPKSHRSEASLHSERGSVNSRHLAESVHSHKSSESLQRSQHSVNVMDDSPRSQRSGVSVHSKNSSQHVAVDVVGSPLSGRSVHSPKSLESLQRSIRSQHSEEGQGDSPRSQRSGLSVHSDKISQHGAVDAMGYPLLAGSVHSHRSQESLQKSIHSPHSMEGSPRSDLSRPSGVFSDHSPPLSARSDPESDKDQEFLGSSFKSRDSFTLEQPPALVSESEDVKRYKYTLDPQLERPSSPVAETLAQINSDGSTGISNETISVLKNVMGDKSPASPLFQEMRGMWKDLLTETEKGGAPTPRSRLSLSQGFSSITERIGRDTETDAQGGGDNEEVVTMVTKSRGFHAFQMDEEEDQEVLDDIKMPELFVDMESPQQRSQRSRADDLLSSDISLLRSGSLGDQVFGKPKFPLTKLSPPKSDEVLISFTPQREGSNLVSNLNNNDIENRQAVEGVLEQALEDSEIEFNLKNQDIQDLESLQRSINDLLGRSLDRSAISNVTESRHEEGGDENHVAFLRGQAWGIVDEDEEGLDDIQLDLDLDDSFVPLKEGFKLERGTPGKRKSPEHLANSGASNIVYDLLG